VIPRNVGEEQALPPQSNSVKTFVMARVAPVPGSGERLKICLVLRFSFPMVRVAA
jgi:hypothetical protein